MEGLKFRDGGKENRPDRGGIFSKLVAGVNKENVKEEREKLDVSHLLHGAHWSAMASFLFNVTAYRTRNTPLGARDDFDRYQTILSIFFRCLYIRRAHRCFSAILIPAEGTASPVAFRCIATARCTDDSKRWPEKC